LGFEPLARNNPVFNRRESAMPLVKPSDGTVLPQKGFSRFLASGGQTVVAVDEWHPEMRAEKRRSEERVLMLHGLAQATLINVHVLDNAKMELPKSSRFFKVHDKHKRAIPRTPSDRSSISRRVRSLELLQTDLQQQSGSPNHAQHSNSRHKRSTSLVASNERSLKSVCHSFSSLHDPMPPNTVAHGVASPDKSLHVSRDPRYQKLPGGGTHFILSSLGWKDDLTGARKGGSHLSLRRVPSLVRFLESQLATKRTLSNYSHADR